MLGCFQILFALLFTTNVLSYASPPRPTSIVLDETDDRKTWCTERKCIRKCCAKDEHIEMKEEGDVCIKGDTTFGFTDIEIYNNINLDMRIDKAFSDLFYLIPGQYYELLNDEKNKSFSTDAFVATDFDMNTHLSESGNLYLEFPNSYNRWTLVDYFCVDYVVSGSSIVQKFWSVLSDKTTAKSNVYFTTALILSSLFLFVVLLVYILLPELQNLVGLVLMAYVFSLMMAFISLICLQLDEYSTEGCIALTATTYFFFLSTFCWMNVMSYDIWWTFRGYAKARPIHRRGEKFKFGMYCIYGWGVPLAMTIALIVVNKLDLSDKPWIVKPLIPDAGCFLEGGQKLVYLYIPMLILILCNWFFFLMTAFNIWRLSRGTSVVNSDAAGNPAAHRSQKNRLMIYLKLSIIMGVNWLLEVVSFFSPELLVWNITDAYNLLIGLAIFLIFVFKMKIYNKLCERYLGKRSIFIVRNTNSASSNTLESNLSQETPLQISTHPMGKPSKRY